MIKIIKSEIKHIEKIVDIGRKSLPIYYDEINLINLINDKNHKIYLIEIEEKIVGFIIYEKLNINLHIKSLAIDPEYRRKGYGSELLLFIKGKLKNRDYITLYVLKSNEDAINLYKKNEFKFNKLLKKYYTTLNEEDGEEYIYYKK